MSDESYTPPEVWTWDQESGGRFASINRPISGATHDKDLPVGKHPHQLYSLATPNGQKVTIMFEELLAAGHGDAEYDAWLINIGDGDQFGTNTCGSAGFFEKLRCRGHGFSPMAPYRFYRGAEEFEVRHPRDFHRVLKA